MNTAISMAAGVLGLMAQGALAAIEVPAGRYVLDPDHAYITFSYSHLGFSTPHVGFNDFEVELDFDPASPESSQLRVRIAADSIDSRVEEFDEHLLGERFFDTENFPDITFKSTGIVMGVANDATLTGELTIKGQTHPVELAVVLNRAGIHPMLKKPAMGFNAQGLLKRSQWGLNYGAPMVGDEIRLYISVELQADE